MKFFIEADDGRTRRVWIEEFRDEGRAREVLPKRGFKLLAIRASTPEDEEQLSKVASAPAISSDHIVLTTGFAVANAEIEREVEIITAECSYGINLFRDLFMEARDIFGGRSEALQKVLRDARRSVLAELKHEAALIGADAVVGVQLDYQEVNSGKMMFVVASGTAVKLRPKSQSTVG